MKTMSSKLNTRNWQLPESEVHEFFPKRTKYCICIPLINEGNRITTQLKKMKKYSKLADIILADGGSTDGALKRTFLRQQHVRTLLIKTSPGRQGTQLRMGFAYALKEGYEGIITIDGNNKDGVEAIPRFIQALDEGFDNIQGSRYIKGGKAINTPKIRDLAIRLLGSPIISMGAKFRFTDVTNGYRGYSKKYLLHPQART
jgi:dolichol-phosphate mannosyltransferase